MFSFFKKIVSYILPWESSDQPNYFIESDEEVINRIRQSINLDNKLISKYARVEPEPLGQSKIVQHDVNIFKQVQKTGRITHLFKDYGVIDNVFYFYHNQVSPNLVVKLNDEVVYSAYKVRENEAERVYKIYGLVNDAWFSAEPNIAAQSEAKSHNVQETKYLSAINRVITGRVTQRRGREVYVESANIWCNLDKLQASYVPYEGDWVELHALVSVGKDTDDLSGEILEVLSLKPLLLKKGLGRVTLWSDMKKEGAIENLVYFTMISCENGYVPNLGDEVSYEAVESDQERFRWRALKVCVNNEILKGRSTNGKADNSSVKDNSVSYCDKNGISIVPLTCSVEIELNQTKEVTLEVINNGTVKQFLIRTKFQKREQSQLMLLNHKLSDAFIIQPKQKIQYRLQCKGKILGLSVEVFFFHFEDFVIARKFEINVIGNKEMNKLLDCKFDTVITNFRKEKFIRSNIDADVVLYGSRPWKPPKFISKERKCVFSIPQRLWDIVTSNSFKNAQDLINYAPFLKFPLMFSCYADWFHTLLYLEEIELRLSFRNYDLNGIFLSRKDEYFVLNVPDLIGKKLSVLAGDKVVLSQEWSKGDKIKHVGFIHHIQANDIFVKFHNTFHETYDESECNVSFEPSTISFTRCHEAVNRAVKILGQQWLFPCPVQEKPPLFNFHIPEDGNFCKQIPMNQNMMNSDLVCRKITEMELNKNECLSNMLLKKNLVWVNKNLNDRQKLAVVSVLEGKGRPLPYLIFGPPGTGKTVTLVEIIIQIYSMLPESRILVATPSNSSADLISERLIEAGNFKPGELVRLVAEYRMSDKLVPAKLVPYSTCVKGRDGGIIRSKPNTNSNTNNDVTGRQRITVATCVTTGLLHYLGLQPGHFTHILVDEAGQTTEPEVLISATFQKSQNEQVILAGDPQQLGAVILSKVARDVGLGVSLLQRFISLFPYACDLKKFPDTSGFDPRFITKLNVNYRNVPEILSLPSQLFYNSDLIPTVSQTDSKEAEIIKKFNFKAENRSKPAAIIFHSLIGQNYQESDSPSWFNPHEIWQVVFYVRKLYSVGLKCKDIGIISPYVKQVQKLIILLNDLKLAQPKIGSVEEFQGQERYVIILTTVRSSIKVLSNDIKHSLGFVASPRRLNVALTRARALLIIVGNPVLLSKDPYWMNVIKYCSKNNSVTGCNIDIPSLIVNDEDNVNDRK